MKPLPNFPQIQNYSIEEIIHQSDRTLVYRGQNTENERPIVIKLMGNKYPSFSELVQFRNQYAIALNLDIPGIVKPYALKRYKNGYALIMEDMGGFSLAENRQQLPLSLQLFLDISLQLAEILHHLHQNQIIHKDIKPANILIHPETKQVKLIDFSISSLLPKETLSVQPPNFLEGTLAYLSPEQTGRMNRGIDYRSDFYCLGVTFYELLTGKLPFESEDPLELVHAHIAKIPSPVTSHQSPVTGYSIPTVLSDIVMKLMAKNAEDRYQSALGLKYDLEKCRSQWQETGQIELFKLGEEDRSDRFLIPEKLYGRDKEVQALLDAFERVANPPTPPTPLSKGGVSDNPPMSPLSKGGFRGVEMILVAGFSGIGKTAVVNEVHKPITRAQGYFIKGKFDQFNRNIPFSAFVQAFRDLMGQLLGESDAKLQQWKEKIIEAVGENGQVLIDVIPELERIIGEQPSVAELRGREAQNRFNLLLEKFIGIFTTKEHPLTLFIDDLQWADSASLNLLKVLMGENQIGYLLLLGAYRDNEVFPAHPLMLTLAELEGQNTRISTITLPPLSVGDINQLVAETLSCSLELAAPLTDLVYQKTKGNPFFTTQFLKGLHEDGLIVFNQHLGYWECDRVQVQDAALTDDVVEFMAERLHKLPDRTQSILKLAACIGNQFDLELLAIVWDTSSEKAAAALWSSLREGLILPESEAYKFFQGMDDENLADAIDVNYRFLHDRVQQAAYSLIPEAQKASVHLEIGWRLYQNIPAAQRNENIFAMLESLNRGRSRVTTESDREQIARLNLSAAQKAKNATAYEAALEYCTIGIELLSAKPWEEQYDLCFSLHLAAGENAYLISEFDRGDRFGKELVENGNNLLDRCRGYNLKIHVAIARVEFSEALDLGLNVLGQLGIELPENPPDNLEPEFYRHLPITKEPQVLLAASILGEVTHLAYVMNPQLFLSAIFALMHLSAKSGNTPNSSLAYSYYGMHLCCNTPKVDLGYQFSKMGLQLLDRFDSRAFKSESLNSFNGHVRHWKEHARECLEPLKEAFACGRESGELVFSGYAIMHYLVFLLAVGQPLEFVKQEFDKYLPALAAQKLEYHVRYCKIWLDANLKLLGESDDREDSFDTESIIPLLLEQNNRTTLASAYISRSMLLYLLLEPEQALAQAEAAESYLSAAAGMLKLSLHNFYYSLALLAAYPQAKPQQQQDYRDRLAVNQEKMAIWAHHAPMNFQHKYDLVEAEKLRVLGGDRYEIMPLYERAIDGAKENGYLQEEALANELAAQFYLDWGKEKHAALYIQEAYYCYARWGAKAKVKDLEERYPQLLSPILTPQPTSTSSNVTLSTQKTRTLFDTSVGIGEILDLASLMKASRTLSRDIARDLAITNLMQVIQENAAAETVALMLSSKDTLILEAKITVGQTETRERLPIEETTAVPLTIVNTVKRTQQPLILIDASQFANYAGDRYIQQHEPRSVLCLPLQDRGRAIGILYLENNRAIGAFTEDRVEVLSLLCAQAAITLENARLYQQAQQALQLEKELARLQRTQLQLIQSEKMFSLGKMVGGIAHEINNPVTFIHGNINHANTYMQDILQLLELYQQHYPQPVSEIQESIEDMDLAFVQEDFQHLLTSMESGSDRISKIVASLRTFARLDEAEFKSVNLQEGIDSTLTILQSRLQATETRAEIKIIKDYGELPRVACYAGQLNQVFLNILNNAIDALEKYEGQESPLISIATKRDENNAKIVISDNGTGMNEETKERLFDPFFTTKEVGKGTGLGMAIAHQIITEKHGGTITCQSEVGKGTKFTIAIPCQHERF